MLLLSFKPHEIEAVNEEVELKQSSGMNVKVGRMLKAMNFERKEVNKGTTYYLVPLQQGA